MFLITVVDEINIYPFKQIIPVVKIGIKWLLTAIFLFVKITNKSQKIGLSVTIDNNRII